MRCRFCWTCAATVVKQNAKRKENHGLGFCHDLFEEMCFSLLSVWVIQSDGILDTLCLLLWMQRTRLCVDISVVYVLVTLTVYLSLCPNLFLCCSCGFYHCWGYQECDGVKTLATLSVNVCHCTFTYILFMCVFFLCFFFLFFVLSSNFFHTAEPNRSLLLFFSFLKS